MNQAQQWQAPDNLIEQETQQKRQEHKEKQEKQEK